MVRVRGEGALTGPGGFADALDDLVQRLWTWSPSRWTDARVGAARALVERFADLAAAHGQGPPRPVPIPHVEAYGLADQLAVLGADVLRTHDERAASDALAALRQSGL